MTQDQTGQARGTGYVDRGQAVPDDETDVSQTEQSGAVTRLKKVASALRGDRPDQTVPDQAVPGQTVPDQAVPDQAVPDQTVPDEMAMTTPVQQGQSGSWAAEPAEDGAVNSTAREDEMNNGEYADATRPNEAGAVRSPQAASRDYEVEQGRTEMTRNQDAAPADPSIPGSVTYDTTSPAGTAGTAPAPGYANQAGTAAGYGSQADTGTAPSSSPGMTTQDYGSQQAGTRSGYGSEADTATGRGTRGDIASDPQGLTGSRPGVTGAGPADVAATDAAVGSAAATGATASGAAGRHAAGAEDAGLRPGEATDRLGDFGDIAFGNLLPDAEQYSAQWQQIQFRFVDDPQGSVTEAAEVISQVTSKLEAAIQERQQAIEERQRAIQERASALRGRWGEGSKADTETLRETLRMYRVFMDQLVGSSTP